MITKDMTIGEIIRSNKEGIVDKLMSLGMGCIGCPSAQVETLEEACHVHGLNVEDVLKKLND